MKVVAFLKPKKSRSETGIRFICHQTLSDTPPPNAILQNISGKRNIYCIKRNFCANASCNFKLQKENYLFDCLMCELQFWINLVLIWKFIVRGIRIEKGNHQRGEYFVKQGSATTHSEKLRTLKKSLDKVFQINTKYLDNEQWGIILEILKCPKS